MTEETITLTRSELAALIEAAVSEALAAVAPILEAHERRKEDLRKYSSERYANDPNYRARVLSLAKEGKERRRKDPAYLEQARAKDRARQAERLANDPEYRERRNAATRRRSRERWASDPEYRERIATYARERRANDPEFRERANAAARARRAAAKNLT